MKKKVLIALSSTLIILLCAVIIVPLDFSRFEDYSQVILDKNGKILRVFLNKEEQWHLSSSEEIPHKLEKAVLNFEDKYFYFHPGINPFALFRAFYLNIKNKTIVSGGSTISMQVCRISYPKKRTYLNKIYEILQSLKLELLYSKQEIFRLYLNNAPYGKNIIGFRTASLKYFGKEPKNLTWSEAATLAVLPNSPGLLAPDKNSKILITKRNYLLKKLNEKGFLDSLSFKLSLKEPMNREIEFFPQKALHLTRHINQENKSDIVKTTIDKSIQDNTELILKEEAALLHDYGINNVSALICETKTGKIRAYCGSQDFFDTKRLGKVDGVLANRSTGSTLKPFLYGLCIDDGIILPQTKVKDIPSYFGNFSPENANSKFSGIVTAHEALIRSLNVPAVRLLNQYGLKDFYDFLSYSGVGSLKFSADHYGLTLIIGGSEISLMDLVKLYRGLGKMGKFGDISFLKNKSEKVERQLISSAAAYSILEVLKDVKRPGIDYYWNRFDNQIPFAWKTGTSYGNRDAWAVGVNSNWTIGVWTGNFEGEGNPMLSGAKTAGPILFRLLNSLDNGENPWFEAPVEEMRTAVICKETGYLARDFCIEKDTVLVPEKMYTLEKCPYHKKIFVNSTEKYQVCSHCWEADNYHSKVVLNYPPTVITHLERRGKSIAKNLFHNPECPMNFEEKSFQIVYPQNNSLIYLPKDFGGSRQKLIVDIASKKEALKLYCYLNGKFLGKYDLKESLCLNLEYGDHKLVLTDQKGFSQKVEFEIVSE